jgi:TolB-like protein
MGMANFFAELKRRQMYRVEAAYAVVAWLLLQLVNNVAPILDLPVWVARAFLLLLVIGFPITLLFAWMRDFGPAEGATAKPATGTLDWALIGALVLVIALVSYQQLTVGSGTADQATPVRLRSASSSGHLSIAVLPSRTYRATRPRFLLRQHHRRISSALARFGLARHRSHVGVRIQGQNRNVRAIGRSLGASHLIEGSVRQAGNRVRITAQLVRAGDGVRSGRGATAS